MDAPTAKFDEEEIRKGIATLLAPGKLYELRVPKYRGEEGNTVAGFFDDPVALVKWLKRLSGHASGIYLSINPVGPEHVAVRNVCAQKVRRTAKDFQVASRDWLLIDIDPVRAEGHVHDCATEQEKLAARAVARSVVRALKEAGWYNGVLMDSGNGYQARYRIGLPNDAESRRLVGECLRALGERFDTPAAQVDRTVYNASRIAKFPGTLNAKGKDTEERPHRLARIVYAYEGIVAKGQLEALAATAKPVEHGKATITATGRGRATAYSTPHTTPVSIPQRTTRRQLIFPILPSCATFGDPLRDQVPRLFQAGTIRPLVLRPP